MQESAVRPSFPRRLHELEERFAALEPRITDSPEKEALSVMHGMIIEVWRSLQRNGGAISASGLTIEDIATMYRHAPSMDGDAVATGLAPGTPAPDFALADPNGETVRLSDHRGHPVVLVFYPLDWSPTCSDQLSLYQSELAEFERRGARLLAISVDSLYSHGAWAAVRGLQFPLLADFHPKGEVARQFNVWRENDGFSERALFVIDAEGTVRYCHVSPRLHQVPDIYELFEALDRVAQPAGAAA